LNTALNDLLSAWKKTPLTCAPYALTEDNKYFESLGQRGQERYTTFDYTCYLAGGLGPDPKSKLHLGLLPQPWCGDLESAKVFILLLNPGLNPGDYFGEYQVPKYKEALIETLRSTYSAEYPFLDPQFCWHPGAHYWRKRLDWLVRALVEQKKEDSYLRALSRVAREVCALQLVPYHSVA
jgi:hypothetical protein